MCTGKWHENRENMDKVFDLTEDDTRITLTSFPEIVPMDSSNEPMLREDYEEINTKEHADTLCSALNVAILPSKITGAGLGLFSTKARKKAEITLGCMWGVFIDAEDSLTRQEQGRLVESHVYENQLNDALALKVGLNCPVGYINRAVSAHSVFLKNLNLYHAVF